MLRVNVLGISKPLDFHLGIPVAATEEGPALVDGGSRSTEQIRNTVYYRPSDAFTAGKKIGQTALSCDQPSFKERGRHTCLEAKINMACASPMFYAGPKS